VGESKVEARCEAVTNSVQEQPQRSKQHWHHQRYTLGRVWMTDQRFKKNTNCQQEIQQNITHLFVQPGYRKCTMGKAGLRLRLTSLWSRLGEKHLPKSTHQMLWPKLGRNYCCSIGQVWWVWQREPFHYMWEKYIHLTLGNSSNKSTTLLK
jgi:hypothetical protein